MPVEPRPIVSTIAQVRSVGAPVFAVGLAIAGLSLVIGTPGDQVALGALALAFAALALRVAAS